MTDLLPGFEPTLERDAHLSDDGVYRYALTRRWDNGPTLTFVMLNPSTADADRDDPTIRRCVGFARRLGYAGLEVVNLYAYRATDPADLKRAGYPTGGQLNDDTLARVAQQPGTVVAAWGTHAQPDRVAHVLTLPGWRKLTALGVTIAGAPKHPLARGHHRIPDDAVPVPWPGPDTPATATA